MQQKKSYLEDLIKSYEAEYVCSVSVACLFIEKSQDQSNIFSWQNRIKRPAASLAKLFILGALAEKIAQRQCNLSQSLAISGHVTGSGLLKYVGTPTALTVRELVHLMISYSDNTAANTLLSFVTIERVDDFINRLGVRNTKIAIPMMPTTEEAKRDYNYTTAEDIMIFYRGIVSGFPVSIHHATAQICKDLFASSRNSFIDITRFLISATNIRSITKIAKRNPFMLIKYLYAALSPLWRKRLTAHIPTKQIVAQKSATGKHIFHDSCIIGLSNGFLSIVSMIECPAANFYKKASIGHRSANSLNRVIGGVLFNTQSRSNTRGLNK